MQTAGNTRLRLLQRRLPSGQATVEYALTLALVVGITVICLSGVMQVGQHLWGGLQLLTDTGASAPRPHCNEHAAAVCHGQNPHGNDG
ncbi:MAG: hypothetical protein HY332_06605 [Chloroflexi bacterium]|nr:hypothetical protein [Chloroflexota bacterium]